MYDVIMSKRAFTYNFAVIKSDDEALKDFHIQYLPAQRRNDLAARWVLYLDDIVICFAERFYLSDLGEFEFFDDGRIKIEFEILGMPVDYITMAVKKVVPAFKHFTSREQQDKVIDLFLEAMNVFEIPTGGEIVKVRAVIGDYLQAQIDSGKFLR